MNLLIITAVLFGHWVGDFILQENNLKASKDKKLINKIKKLVKHLLPHTLTYTAVLTLMVGLLVMFKVLIYSLFGFVLFFIITYVTHFITDFIITMINSKFLMKNGRHKYFVSIGLDQLIHYLTLFATIILLFL